MTLDGTTITDRGIPGYRGAGTGDTLALAVCWCPDEPARLGEVFLLPRHPLPYVLGRGESVLDGHSRAVAVRQRPGVRESTAPIAIGRLSRHQLLIEVEAARALHVRNNGRCRLYHQGRRVDAAEVRPGEVLQLGSCLLLLCTLRPWELRGTVPPEAPPFGEPDSLGIVGESPAVWSVRGGAAGRSPPSLSQRREDVWLEARDVLRDLAREDPSITSRFFDGDHPRVGPTLARQLLLHDFTDDRRELEAMLRASLVHSQGNFLEITGGGAAHSVLLVDGDTSRRTSLVRALGEAWQVVAIADPDAAATLPPQRYDAAVIDAALPSRTLRSFTQWARAVARCRTVALLDAARSDLAGADLSVPADPDSLMASLERALLVSGPRAAVIPLQCGSVDLPSRTVTHGDESITLTPTEALLLAYLAEHPGRPVPRDELLTEVWGYRAGVESRTVDTTVRRLRKKVELDHREPFHLRTVAGVGYRFHPLPA